MIKKSLFFALTISVVNISSAALAGDKDDGDHEYFQQPAKATNVAYNNSPQKITSDFTPHASGGQSPVLAAQSNKPVMVIRFNQPRVNYEMQLYTVLQKTLEIKPNATFDVVSLIPSTGSERYDYENKEVASENSQHFLKTVSEIGLPLERVRMSYQGSNEVLNNELRVFIR